MQPDNFRKSDEYSIYRRIAQGTSPIDLREAIDYYRKNERTFLDELLLGIGFDRQPLRIRAFEDVLDEKSHPNPNPARPDSQK